MKKKLLSILTLFAGVLLITGCSVKAPNSTGSNTTSGSTETKATEKLEKNITSSGALTERGKLVVFAKNNNKVNIDLTIEVEFYDENGTLVGSDKEYLSSVGAGSEVAVEMYETPSSFSKYDIYTDAKVETITKSFVNDLEISHNKTENVVAQVKNNSDEVISAMEVAIVYYQGEKVVGFDYGYESDVKPGRSGNFNFSNPYNNNYDDISYDNYKIFINQAYSYTN